MKKTILIICILCFSSILFAQNANLVLSGSGVRIVSSGSPEIVLHNANVINNASAASFEPATGTVRFLGATANASIGGSAAVSLYNLRVNKLGFELDLNTNVNVSNQAELIDGNLDLNNQTLDLTTTGIVSGEVYPNGRRFYCADNQAGLIRATRVLGSGANANIAGLQLDLTVSGAAPGSTIISRGHDNQTSTAFVGAGTSIGRYYDLTPTINTGFTYTFLFRYHDQEVGLMPESSFVFYRSTSYGVNTADWQEWGNGTGLFSPGYPTVGIASHNPTANTVSLSGINTFSRWTVSNAVVSPLPIELISFTSTCNDGEVVLNWKTATELNNHRFVVERSSNLQSWEEIKVLSGAGTSNQELSYSVMDERPLDGLAYYRLSQIDYDGASETFDPISISCKGGKEVGVMTVFPNPVADVFTVSIYSPIDVTQAKISFSDVNGKVVMTKNITLSAGTNNFMYDRSSMNPGAYFIQLMSEIEGIKPLKLIIR